MRGTCSGGITPRACAAIQYDFIFEGVRYRPSLRRIPTEVNLRRAREHLAAIKERIAAGTFQFVEEFPDYRRIDAVMSTPSQRMCGHVFDAFMNHCASLQRMGGMEAITVAGYRKIIDGIWRPTIGHRNFLHVSHSELVSIADAHVWSRKTYNNAISALRVAFEFGFRDHPQCHNPASMLKCVRIRKRDRVIDPFRIEEAERLIATIRQDWGEAQANYDEFRFFTGLRPSEEIALLVSDYDAVNATLRVSKARVAGIDKNCTKTGEDRIVTLCPRAIRVVSRQLKLRERLKAAGLIEHEHLFFGADGAVIRHLQYVARRWRHSLSRLPDIRYRRPYNARHSSVSWNLMIGKSPLWVSKQHGHRPETMFRAYAAWTEGAPESEIAVIREAMGVEDQPPSITRSRRAVAAVRVGTRIGTSGRMPRPKPLKRQDLYGGKGGTRTLDLGIMSATL
jgi:integrase